MFMLQGIFNDKIPLKERKHFSCKIISISTTLTQNSSTEIYYWGLSEEMRAS